MTSSRWNVFKDFPAVTIRSGFLRAHSLCIWHKNVRRAQQSLQRGSQTHFDLQTAWMTLQRLRWGSCLWLKTAYPLCIKPCMGAGLSPSSPSRRFAGRWLSTFPPVTADPLFVDNGTLTAETEVFFAKVRPGLCLTSSTPKSRQIYSPSFYVHPFLMTFLLIFDERVKQDGYHVSAILRVYWLDFNII